MDQLLTMQDREGREQLPHQKQHLSRTEHQLTLETLILDLTQSRAFQPLTHQPQAVVLLQQPAKAWNLRMKQ